MPPPGSAINSKNGPGSFCAFSLMAEISDTACWWRFTGAGLIALAKLGAMSMAAVAGIMVALSILVMPWRKIDHKILTIKLHLQRCGMSVMGLSMPLLTQTMGIG